MECHTTPRYRLLACDLDGTLMGEDRTISTRVRRALTDAQALGVHVTLATGRGFHAALPFAQELRITEPIICYQGGVIKNPKTGALLYQATLERTLTLEVIELARVRDWHHVLYLDDTAYVQEFRYAQGFYDAWLAMNIQPVEDMTQVVHGNGPDPAKILFVGEEEEADRIHAELDARFGGQMNVVRSHALFVEGSPIGADKGNALRRLAEHLKVPQRQVMAIGDQGNDVSMLTWAGLGVAMANGSQAAIAAADRVTLPVSADGAAVAIEQYILKHTDEKLCKDQTTRRNLRGGRKL